MPRPPGTSTAALPAIKKDRMRDAAARAIESSQRVRRKAEQLCEELEDVTPAHGVVTTGLSEEDSMVIAVQKVIAAHK